MISSTTGLSGEPVEGIDFYENVIRPSGAYKALSHELRC